MKNGSTCILAFFIFLAAIFPGPVSLLEKADSVVVSSGKTSCDAGKKDRFTCNVTGGNPPPTVKKIYFKKSGGKPVEITEGQDRVMVKEDNQAEYYCEAKVPGHPALGVTSRRKTYNVTFPHTKVVFLNNPRVAVRVGQVKKFTCETDESNPISTIKWSQYVGSSWRNITSGISSSERNGAYGGKIRISEWSIAATKAMNLAKVRCLSTSHGRYSAAFVDTRMYVMLAVKARKSGLNRALIGGEVGGVLLLVLIVVLLILNKRRAEKDRDRCRSAGGDDVGLTGTPQTSAPEPDYMNFINGAFECDANPPNQNEPVHDTCPRNLPVEDRDRCRLAGGDYVGLTGTSQISAPEPAYMNFDNRAFESDANPPNTNEPVHDTCPISLPVEDTDEGACVEVNLYEELKITPDVIADQIYSKLTPAQL